MSIKQVVMAAIAFVGLAAHAADVAFPNADGSGKILSDAAWAPGTVPTTDRPKFSANKTTYYVDRDGAFNGILFDIDTGCWGTRFCNIQFQNDAKLTLGDAMDVTARNWAIGSWMSMNFKDGKMDFGGLSMRKQTQSHWLGITFENCTVTNVNQLWSGYKSNHNLLTITGGAMWVNNYMMPMRTPDNPSANIDCRDVKIVINGGAKVNVGQFMMSRTWNGGPIISHTDGTPLLDISGVGTEVTLRGTAPSSYSDFGDGLDNVAKNGYSLLTSLGSGEVLRIRDGAKLSAKNGYCIIGCKGGSNGRVIVEGESSELSIGNFRFAQEGTDAVPGTNNYICVRNGGTLTAGTIYSNGYGVGSDNGVICSNATAKIIGPKDNVSKNRLTCRMQGDNPAVRFVADKYQEGAHLTWGQRWVFDLPASGYQSGCVPFRFDGRQFVKTDANSALLTCEINGLNKFFEDMVRKGERSRETVLIGGLNNFSNYGEYSPVKFQEAVTRWNTELQTIVPEKFKASISIVGSTVVLKVKQVFGLILVVR